MMPFPQTIKPNENALAGDTAVVVLVDRSGSMGAIRHDVEAGFLEFLNKQKLTEGAGRTFVTVVQFDDTDDQELTYQDVPLADAPGITIQPRGMTPLHDALGKLLLHTETRFLLAGNAPSKVIFIVVSDGGENTSKEWNGDRVSKEISRLRENNGWEVLFIGTNQDAIKEGASVGILFGQSLSFKGSTVGIRSAFNATSEVVGSYAAGGDASYTVSHRTAAADGDVLDNSSQTS